MVRVFKNRSFNRFARKARIDDRDLCSAAEDISEGRCDATLGQGVFKQRIARAGEGKSGGFRSIIVLKPGRHAFFVHGFAKRDQANITLSELTQLQKLAKFLLLLEEDLLRQEINSDRLIEVNCNG